MRSDEGAKFGDEKPCPFCGEQIKKSAKKCRMCGEWLDAKLKQARRGVTEKARGPIVLQVWGVGVMGLAGLGFLISILQTLSILFLVGRGGPGMGAVMIGVVAGVGISFLFYFVIFRLGLGLFRGQRAAVIGMAMFWGLGALVAILFFASGEPTPGLVVLGIASVVYGPPSVIGFMRWEDLVWRVPTRGQVTSSRRGGLL